MTRYLENRLKELGVYTMFLENQRLAAKVDDASTITVFTSFSWENSPQGNEFWYKVFRQI